MQNRETATAPVVAVAGANGHLGQKIVSELVRLGTRPRALVRRGSKTALPGADVYTVDYHHPHTIVDACRHAHCVVSALSGVKNAMLDAQTALLNAAVAGGVQRFIPSDFCIDYTKLPEGSNRNLDLRRAFQQRLEAAPIAATSILNGMFTDLLLGEAPLVHPKWKMVLYWGHKNQPLDFTTMHDTAAFTARAALENATPRFLRIAGDTISSKGLQEAASAAMGQPFRLVKIGGLGLLKGMIAVTKTLLPQPQETFPPWQGMQYLHNMYTGMPRLYQLDNNRYPEVKWTSVKEVLQGAKDEQ